MIQSPISHEELSSTPSNPASGYVKTFVNSNGELCLLDSNGNVTVLNSTQSASSSRDQANIMLNSILANPTVHGMAKGFADGFFNETGVDTVNCVNQIYDADGDFYSNTASYSGDVTSTAYAINSSYNPDHYPSCAFADDGDTTWWESGESIPNIANASYIGQDFGDGVTKRIGKIRILNKTANYAPSSAKVQRSDNGTSWTDVASIAINASSTSWQEWTFPSSTAARYWRVLATANPGVARWYVAEMEMMEVSADTDMTLISNSFEALEEPSKAQAFLMIDPVDPVTINTDVKVYVSLDDGSNYEQVTMAKVGDYSDDIEIWAGTEELTSHSDQTMRIKVETANDKFVEIHAWGLSWE